MSLLLRIPRKRKEKPVPFLQVELVSNKVARKQPLSSEEDINFSKPHKKVRKRVFKHVFTLNDNGIQDVEPSEEPWSCNKRHISSWDNFKQKNIRELDTSSDWKVLDLTDTFEERNFSSFTLNDDPLLKEYVGELAEDPFTTSESKELVYDLYELSCASEFPVQENGPSIRVLADTLDEDWLVAETEKGPEDDFSSDSNRTYDYPETPKTCTEDDSNISDNWYDSEENDENTYDDKEVPLWRTQDLLRKLQRTTIYDSSSSSYNSEDSNTYLTF